MTCFRSSKHTNILKIYVPVSITSRSTVTTFSVSQQLDPNLRCVLSPPIHSLSRTNEKHSTPTEFYLNSGECLWSEFLTKITHTNDLPYWAYICGSNSLSHGIKGCFVVSHVDIRRLGKAFKSSKIVL